MRRRNKHIVHKHRRLEKGKKVTSTFALFFVLFQFLPSATSVTQINERSSDNTKLALFENLQNIKENITSGDSLIDRVNSGSLQERLTNFKTLTQQDWKGNARENFTLLQDNWQDLRGDYRTVIDEAMASYSLDFAKRFTTRFEDIEALLDSARTQLGLKTSIRTLLEQRAVLFYLSGGIDEIKAKHNPMLDASQLIPRVVLSEQLPLETYAKDFKNEIVVKFPQIATKYSLNELGSFVDDTLGSNGEILNELSTREFEYLSNNMLNSAVREVMLHDINEVFESIRNQSGQVKPLISSLSSDELNSLAQEGQLSGEEMANYNTEVLLKLPKNQSFDEGVSEIFYVLFGAEYARYNPEPQLAQVPQDVLEQIPNYVDEQGYLEPAPLGIDAKYAWNFVGGTGKNVTIFDVEGGWETSHVDFPNFIFQKGNSDNDDFRHHGTAVVGEMNSLENDFGVTGIAHDAKVGTISFFENGVSDAIALAVSKLKKGDILLLELQATGPKSSQSCTCNCGQFEQIPMEYWQPNFDIVKNAVAKGITVVTPAGNGSMNLDETRYQARFERNKRDSGAIFVGAGGSQDKSPHCWTNFGSRVDVHAWGDTVMTAGYGDIGETDYPETLYTNDFKGTSSAAPIVAGASALLQSMNFEATKGDFLKPAFIRQLLVATGTPQADSFKNIGPLPDLKHAIAKMPIDAVPEDGFVPDSTEYSSDPVLDESDISAPFAVIDGLPLWGLVTAGLILVVFIVVLVLYLKKRSANR